MTQTIDIAYPLGPTRAPSASGLYSWGQGVDLSLAEISAGAAPAGFVAKSDLDAALAGASPPADGTIARVLNDPAHDDDTNVVNGDYVIEAGAAEGPFPNPLEVLVAGKFLALDGRLVTVEGQTPLTPTDLATLQADLAHAPKRLAVVEVVGANRLYIKSGASGAGSWDLFNPVAAEIAAAQSGAVDDVRGGVATEFNTLEKLRVQLVLVAGQTPLTPTDLAALQADLAHNENRLAILETGGVNRIYIKAGASGAGAWSLFNPVAPEIETARAAAVQSASDENAASDAALSVLDLAGVASDFEPLFELPGASEQTDFEAMFQIDPGADPAEDYTPLNLHAPKPLPVKPAVHTVAGREQLAYELPVPESFDVDTGDAVTPTPVIRGLIWSGKAATDSFRLSAQANTNGYYEIIDAFGKNAFVYLSTVPQTVLSNVWDILTWLGQSLVLERTGAGAGGVETWPSYQEFATAPSASIDMLGNHITAITGGGLSPINYSSDTLQPAFDNVLGVPDEVTGNYLQSSRGKMLGALVYRHGPTAPAQAAEKVVIGCLGVGGKLLTYFMPASAGGDGDWWDNALVPYWTRLKALADAAGATVRRVMCPIVHHESAHNADYTRLQYRTELDTFAAALKALAESIFGAGVEFIMAATDGSRMYENVNAPHPAGSADDELSQTQLAIRDKGLSNAPGDAYFFDSSPNFDCSFSQISHMSGDAMGYARLMQRGAYTLCAAINHAGPQKCVPSGPIETAAMLLNGDKTLTIPWASRDGRGLLEHETDENPTRFTGVPLAERLGIYLDGGDAVPETDLIEIVDGNRVNVHFAAPWTGAGRRWGLGFKGESRNQAWRTDNGDPDGNWINDAARSNLFVRQGEICLITGREIPHYAPQFIANLPD